jgi:hypothetical protein
MAWCLVKHRDNFTFNFNFTISLTGIPRYETKNNKKDLGKDGTVCKAATAMNA